MSIYRNQLIFPRYQWPILKLILKARTNINHFIQRHRLLSLIILVSIAHQLMSSPNEIESISIDSSNLFLLINIFIEPFLRRVPIDSTLCYRKWSCDTFENSFVYSVFCIHRLLRTVSFQCLETFQIKSKLSPWCN